MKKLTIWKYTLTSNHTELLVPADYQVLDVQLQHGIPQLCLLVDPLQPQHKMVASVYGTGHIIELGGDNDIGWYAGTFQDDGGDLIWHVFLKDEIGGVL